ncbi:hypothetical protein HanIR_Chr08g0368481 [Helianthus annuus]|nr:hypothetical protein HanIR_Chr08g0368481 [Helianthus annuus]
MGLPTAGCESLLAHQNYVKVGFGPLKRVRVGTGQLQKGLFWFRSKRVRVGMGSGRKGFGLKRSGSEWVFLFFYFFLFF